jgi:hypothetical protein
VIGHRTTPPPSGGVVRTTRFSFCLAFSSPSATCGSFGEFCTCNEARKSVCLDLPIERLTPSRGPEERDPDGSGSGTRLRVRPTSNRHHGMIRDSVLRAATSPRKPV